MTAGTLILAKVTINADQLSNSIIRLRVQLCSIEEEFDYRTFDCVRLAQYFGEFDYVRLPNPIELNRLSSIWFDYRTFD